MYAPRSRHGGSYETYIFQSGQRRLDKRGSTGHQRTAPTNTVPTRQRLRAAKAHRCGRIDQ